VNIVRGAIGQATAGLFGDGIAFLKRQQRDWKVTVVRTSLDKFAYQMVFPYLSVYIVALGATGTQLGIVNSIGMIVAGLCGPLAGGLIGLFVGPVVLSVFYDLVSAWVRERPEGQPTAP